MKIQQKSSQQTDGIYLLSNASHSAPNVYANDIMMDVPVKYHQNTKYGNKNNTRESQENRRHRRGYNIQLGVAQYEPTYPQTQLYVPHSHMAANSLPDLQGMHMDRQFQSHNNNLYTAHNHNRLAKPKPILTNSRSGSAPRLNKPPQLNKKSISSDAIPSQYHMNLTNTNEQFVGYKQYLYEPFNNVVNVEAFQALQTQNNTHNFSYIGVY